SAADLAAGVELGAAWSDHDAAGQNVLAAVDLDAQALAGRLAAVADRSLTFLVSHVNSSAVFSRVARPGRTAHGRCSARRRPSCPQSRPASATTPDKSTRRAAPRGF